MWAWISSSWSEVTSSTTCWPTRASSFWPFGVTSPFASVTRRTSASAAGLAVPDVVPPPGPLAAEDAPPAAGAALSGALVQPASTRQRIAAAAAATGRGRQYATPLLAVGPALVVIPLVLIRRSPLARSARPTLRRVRMGRRTKRRRLRWRTNRGRRRQQDDGLRAGRADRRARTAGR